jgi:hypothetical protein
MGEASGVVAWVASAQGRSTSILTVSGVWVASAPGAHRGTQPWCVGSVSAGAAHFDSTVMVCRNGGAVHSSPRAQGPCWGACTFPERSTKGSTRGLVASAGAVASLAFIAEHRHSSRTPILHLPCRPEICTLLTSAEPRAKSLALSPGLVPRTLRGGLS